MKKTTAQEIGLKCEDSIRRLAKDFDAKLKRLEVDFGSKLNSLSNSIAIVEQQLASIVMDRKDVVDELIQVNGFDDYKLEGADVFEKTAAFDDGGDDAVDVHVHQVEESISENNVNVEEERQPTNGTDDGTTKTCCKMCDAQISNRRQLVKHMVNVHGQEQRYKCDRCPKQFSDRYAFGKHIETLHLDRSAKRKYYCDICPKVLTTKSGLTVHKRVHSGEKPYECDICSTQFSQRNSLIHHMRVHTKERPYMCHECSKTFGSRNSFRLHTQTHLGIKPHKCSYVGCEWAFLQKSKLAVHMQSHTGERPAICPICQKGYSKRYHVRKHIKKFHKIEDVDGVLDAKRRGRPNKTIKTEETNQFE